MVLQTMHHGAANYASWCCKLCIMVLQTMHHGAANYALWCCKLCIMVLQTSQKGLVYWHNTESYFGVKALTLHFKGQQTCK